ncbi:MAG: hypothetical protein EAS48_00495 [Chryseobacterium sp.]|nr:MAG: hypothetical protein EAS48_00495 [Chryseobacterium sp.]
MAPFKSAGRYRITAFAILVGGFISAQTDTIHSDRPDRTHGTGTLKKKSFQIENGVTFGSEDLMNNFMLRHGLTDNTEIRLLIDAGKEEGVKGIMPITLGLKQRIAEENGPLPAVAFVGSLMIQPLATKDFRDTGVDFYAAVGFRPRVV